MTQWNYQNIIRTLWAKRMPIPFEWDFKNPDYAFVFKRRIEKIKTLRSNPDQFSILHSYYKKNPAQFIINGQEYDRVRYGSGAEDLKFPKCDNSKVRCT